MEIYISMIIVGIILIGWGLWATYNMKRPFDTIGAISAPIGLVITLLGILLVCIPGFFS